jgi:hypothetical protein
MRSNGQSVQLLQAQLNARLKPSPGLRVDGYWGPLTQQAVVQYQTQMRVGVDGVVGPATWGALLNGKVAKAKDNSPVSASARATPANSTVASWTLEEKFTEVLDRTASKLPGSIQGEFRALLSAANGAVIAGTLAVWALSHAVGIGEAVDIVLLVGGLAMLGFAVFDVAHDLADCLRLTVSAVDETGLEDAASHLAKAIAVIGVSVFVALVLKAAGRAKGLGKKASGSATEAEMSATPSPGPKRTKPAGEPPATTLEEMYAQGPAAKAEIDALAESIAKQVGGTVAKAPLKQQSQAMAKIKRDYGGDATRLQDLARNTIVVEKEQYSRAVQLLKDAGAKVKVIEADSNPLGYSGTNSVLRTKAGIPGEIQVNTPEMIYAKESKAVAEAILGKERYAEIASKTGEPGGVGHTLYEEFRVMSKGDPKGPKLATESKAYYDRIRGSLR